MPIKHVFEFHGLHHLSDQWRQSMRPAGRFLVYLQALIGFLTFCLMSDGFGYLLKKAGVSLPGSVAGLICLVLILFLAPSSQAIVNFLKPATSLLLKWLSIFYVPAVVTLPLSLRLVHPEDYPKLAAIQIVGVVFIGVFSGWCLIALMHLRGMIYGFRAVVVADDDHHVANHSSHHELLVSGRAIIAILSSVLILIVLYGVVPDYRRGLFFAINIIVLPAFFGIGQYLHTRFAKLPIPHPLLTTTAANIALIALLAVIGDRGFYALLKSFSISSMNLFLPVPQIGPGDVYLYVLNAAIVSMALPINSQKPTLISHGIELLSASVIVSFGSIVVTVLAARLLQIAPDVIRSIPLRTATTPIAIVTVKFINGNSGIAGVMSVTTGVIGGSIWTWLFNLNRYTKAITRGFAMGSMAQGLGTAIVTAEEPESAPFSSLAMVSVGVMSSVWIAIPPIRSLIESMIQS